MVCDGLRNIFASDCDEIRTLSLPLRSAHPQAPTYEARLFEANHALARRAAARSAVLLKNDNGALPLIALPGVLSKLAVIGRMATSAAVRYQGAGSAAVNAHQLQEPLESIRAHLASGWGGSASSTLLATVAYADGYGEPCVDDPAAIELAVQAAKGADAAVVFVGLPSTYEVEGRDRVHMRMPSQMNALVGAVAEANPRTIVVLLGGSSMELSTCDKAVAILWMGLAGQAIGGSIVDVLFGATSPTGRLAETWPMQLDDVPCQANFGRNASIRQVVYREALNVGYRYFCSAKVPVRFPFGHGLTYASFRYSELRLSRASIGTSENVTVQLKLSNTGGVRAAEVVQLYVRDCECSVTRPDRELKAFAKVELAAGAEQMVSLELTPRALAFYDLGAKEWRVEAGEFDVLVGASCEDIRLTAKLIVVAASIDPKLELLLLEAASSRGAGKDATPTGTSKPRMEKAAVLLDDVALAARGLVVPPETPLTPVTAQSTFEEIEQTSWFGRFLVAIMRKEAAKAAKGGGLSAPGDRAVAEAVCVDGLLGSSWCSLQLITGGGLPSFVITLLVHLLNHINKYIVGVLLMAFVLRGESAQPVPEPVIEVVKTGFWLPWKKA